MEDEEVMMNWNAANDYCANKGGRLPTYQELQTAWQEGGYLCYPRHTPGFLSAEYWSSYIFENGGTTFNKTFDFYYGMVREKDTTDEAYVRCVECP
jgi:hypothetical protein